MPTSLSKSPINSPTNSQSVALWSPKHPDILINSAALILFLVVASWLGWSIYEWESGHKKLVKDSFVHSSYFIMLSLFVSWVGCYIYYFQRTQIDWGDYWRQHKKGIILVIALVAAVFASVETTLRVYSDESNLASIAMSMAMDNTTYNSTEGHWYYQSYHSVNNVIPKRPLMLPTLTAMVHTLTGYRVANVFVVNAFALTGLLWLVYLLTQRKFGFTGAVAALFLVLAQPVVSITATSGGFDLLSTCFALLTLIAFTRYYRSPSPIALTLLWLSFLVFSNIRYESLIYGLIMALFLFASQRLRWQDVKANLLLIGPSLLWVLPTIWQRLISQGRYENPKDRGVLSYDAFAEHFVPFVDSQTRFDFFLPYAPILTFAAIATGLFWFAYAVKVKGAFKQVIKKPEFILLAFCLIVNLVIFLSHHNGHYDRPTSLRFFLIFSIAIAWLPITLFHVASEPLKKGIAGLAFILFLGYHSAAMTDKSTRSLLSSRLIEYIDAVAAEQPSKQFLMVTAFSGRHIIYDIGAIGIHRFKNRHRKYQADLDTYLYQDIIVIQRIDTKTGKPIKEDSLPAKFRLEPYKGLKFKGSGYLRVSKMLRTDKAELEEQREKKEQARKKAKKKADLAKLKQAHREKQDTLLRAKNLKQGQKSSPKAL